MATDDDADDSSDGGDGVSFIPAAMSKAPAGPTAAAAAETPVCPEVSEEASLFVLPGGVGGVDALRARCETRRGGSGKGK